MNRPEMIYLVEGEHDGEIVDLWCEDPAPSSYHRAEDSTRYIRADVVEALEAEVEALKSSLALPATITAEPANDYGTLRRQFNALKNVANSCVRTSSHWKRRSDELQEALNARDNLQWEVDSQLDANQQLTDLLEAAEGRIEQLEAEVRQLRQSAVPNERGTNRYGVDVAYFRNLINRELNRPLVDYRPDELARVLLRMAVTADSQVLSEPEFSKHFNINE